MKNYIITALLLLILCTSDAVHAQIDVKIAPFSPLFKRATGAVEFAFMRKKLGIELFGSYTWKDSYSRIIFTPGMPFSSIYFDGEKMYLGINPRYYFKTKKGLDGFYSGVSFGYERGKWIRRPTPAEVMDTNISSGANAGYKLMTRNNRLFFEGNVGINNVFLIKSTFISQNGESTNSIFNFSPMIAIRLLIGYRFGGKKTE